MPLFIQRPVNPEMVEADHIVPGAHVHLTGMRPPRVGDWVVYHVGGATEVLPDETFNAKYEPYVPPPGEEAPTNLAWDAQNVVLSEQSTEEPAGEESEPITSAWDTTEPPPVEGVQED